MESADAATLIMPQYKLFQTIKRKGRACIICFLSYSKNPAHAVLPVRLSVDEAISLLFKRLRTECAEKLLSLTNLRCCIKQSNFTMYMLHKAKIKVKFKN
jgi:hypothetical protein